MPDANTTRVDMTRLLKRSLVWCAIALSVAACGSGSGDSAPPPDVTAFGKAHMASGLADATIEVQDLDGRRPQVLTRTTLANGNFTLALPAERAGAFRLVFRGGTHAGAPFGNALVLDVERFDPNRHLLYANAVTTLAARYRDRHPGVGVAEATARVKRFLGIPAASDAGFDVANPKQTYFDHAQLLAAASTSGKPLAAYLDGLVDEMDRGVAKRAFGAATPIDADAVKKFFKNAAKGLAEHLGDELFSWAFESILTALGISSQSELMEQLHEINAKLDELLNLVNEVLSETKQTEAEIVSVALLGAVSDIKAQYAFLTHAAGYPALACVVDPATRRPVDPKCADELSGLQQTVRARVDAILDPNVGIVHDVELLRTAMAASTSERGLIVRWNEYLKTTKPFYGPAPYDELVEISAFYESVQLTATNLIVEAYMAKAASDRASAKYYVQLHEEAVAKQDALLGEQRGRNGVVLDLRSKLTWQQAPVSNFPASAFLPEGDYWARATGICANLASTAFAGYARWRLPTDPELHEVVKGSPNPTGNADGGSGIFAWLQANGFSGSADPRTPLSSGFVLGNAYISNTESGITYEFYEALSDSGVNFIHRYWSSRGQPYDVPTGAWCVTEESKTAGGEG